MTKIELTKKLSEKFSKIPKLTEPIIVGFIAAWELPGIEPAAKYVRAAASAGRLAELVSAAAAAGRLAELVSAAASVGRLSYLLEAAASAERLGQLVDVADDETLKILESLLGETK